MGDLLIRNVPDGLRATLKARALKSGRSQSDEAKAMILSAALRDLGDKPSVNAWEALAEHRRKFAITDSEHEEFMKIIEEGRKVPDRPPLELE